jgi:hypothetical protein
MTGSNVTKLLRNRAPRLRASRPFGGWTAAVAAAIASTLASPAHAEEPPARRTVILADLGLHIVAVGVQRLVSPRVSLQASAGLYVPWTQTKDVFGVSGDDHAADTGGSLRRSGDPQGGMIRLRPFVYLGPGSEGRGLRGLWVSPFIQGGWVTADRNGTSRTGPAAALGATVGYAWLIADRVHLSLGAGLQVHAARVPGGDGFPSFFQPFPTADISLGYAL